METISVRTARGNDRKRRDRAAAPEAAAMNGRGNNRRGEAGFTLIEIVVAMTLMVGVLAALASVTAQWLPNWNRGFAHVQRAELLARGLERLVADLSAAELVSANGKTRQPLFDGGELSVRFVRPAIGPNTRPGLEFVSIAMTAGKAGRGAGAHARAFHAAAAQRRYRRRDEFFRSGRADAAVLSRGLRLCRGRPHLAQHLAQRRTSCRRRCASPCSTPRPKRGWRSRPRRSCMSARLPNAWAPNRCAIASIPPKGLKGDGL